MSATQKAKLLRKWKQDVYAQGEDIDPHNELDWFALCVGWALGKGVPIKDAKAFAIYVRYQTDVG